MPGMLFRGWLLSFPELFWGGTGGKGGEIQRADTSSLAEAPSPSPFAWCWNFGGELTPFHPEKSQMVHAQIKNLGLGSQSWFIMEHSISCSVRVLLKVAGLVGSGRELQGMEPAKPDAQNGPYLKLAYFYDPFVNLSWSLIKMSEFPMKHLKISSTFHFKNNTPADNLGFQKSTQMLAEESYNDSAWSQCQECIPEPCN